MGLGDLINDTVGTVIDAGGNIFDAAGNLRGKLDPFSGMSYGDIFPSDGGGGSSSGNYIGDPTMIYGGGSPVAADVPPNISDQEVLSGLIALGYSTEDAIALLTESPDVALLIYQGGLRPQGGSYAGSGGGGSGAGTALGYAQLGESQRQFDLEYNEGVRQFNATFDRKAFESDREYELAKDQFALTYAENKRQFDANYGLDARSLDLQTELGRGNLALGNDRLALDRELGMGDLALGRDRLNLDSELGRGRLALDTELGRGELSLGRDRLALDDRLGTGRLNLDTELGRGQLGVNQNAEMRMQRAQVAAERLANRDQELQRTQFVTDVLRKPSDFLARAFMQRGGTSPTGMVTQADIINNLKSSINQFAEGGTTNETMFTTGEQGGRDSTETILNPMNAPIGILNPTQTQQLMNTPTPQAAPQWGDLMGRLGTWRQDLQTALANHPLANMNFPSNPASSSYNPAMPLGDGGYVDARGNTYGPSGNMDSFYASQGNRSNPNRTGGGGGVQAGRIGTWGGGQAGVPTQVATVPGGGTSPTGGASIQPVPNQLPVGGYGNNGVAYNPGLMQPGSTPDWAAALAGTNSTIDLMTLPNVTQQQLIDIGRANLPPAVEAALFSQSGRIPAARPVGNLTLGRLSQLTPGELEALNTQLGVQFNTDLETELALLKSRFGPVVDRARGRFVIQ